MRRFVVTTMFFSIVALIGPLLRWATWPSSTEDFLTPTQFFLYDLVILIWPAQIFWDGEATASLIENLFWSVGGNIFLYALLGAAASFLVSHPRRLFALYLFVCTWGLVIILTVKEFNPAYYDVLAVVAAWAVFAIPFLAVARLVNREQQGTPISRP